MPNESSHFMEKDAFKSFPHAHMQSLNIKNYLKINNYEYN